MKPHWRLQVEDFGRISAADVTLRRLTLLVGPNNSGKSYLACALGRQACYLGYRVEYFSMNKFVEKIALSKIDGTLLKVINILLFFSLLVNI